MTPELAAALETLSPNQKLAVDWGEGAAIVLAGPGVGKTTVLTARIARILDSSRNRNFRILALTFTTKAGDEMRTRVEHLGSRSNRSDLDWNFPCLLCPNAASARLPSRHPSGFWRL